MTVAPESVAVEGLRRTLLEKLPARVTAYNLAAGAVLRAIPGPYTVPATSTLTLASTRESTGTTVSLTAGSRTATQVAAEITGVSGITASADNGTLVLTAAAPALGSVVASDTNSCVSVKEGAAALLSVFGWDTGGESVVTSPLRAPHHKHVRDGWPNRPPDGAAGHFYCIIGDRSTSLVEAAKHQRDEYMVQVALELFVPQGAIDARTRQRISGAVQCVRESLSTSVGRQLGAYPGVLLALVTQAKVAAAPFAFTGTGTPGRLFDAATMTVAVRVWQQPLS
jgi:hypothetical protein